jgi:hypothetical protein
LQPRWTALQTTLFKSAKLVVGNSTAKQIASKASPFIFVRDFVIVPPAVVADI